MSAYNEASAGNVTPITRHPRAAAAQAERFHLMGDHFLAETERVLAEHQARLRPHPPPAALDTDAALREAGELAREIHRIHQSRAAMRLRSRVVRLYRSGWPFAVIAERTGVSRQRVHALLVAAGEPRRGYGRGR